MNLSDFVAVFRDCLPQIQTFLDQLSFTLLAHPSTEVGESQKRPSFHRPSPPSTPDRLPFCSFTGLTCAVPERGRGRLLTQRIRVCHRPSISTAADCLLPTPSIRCVSARLGRRGAPAEGQTPKPHLLCSGIEASGGS